MLLTSLARSQDILKNKTLSSNYFLSLPFLLFERGFSVSFFIRFSRSSRDHLRIFSSTIFLGLAYR